MKLPKLLDTRLQSILWEDYDFVIEAFSQERRGSFRLNLIKGDGSEVWKEFEEKKIIVEKLSGFPLSREWQERELCYFFARAYEYAIKGTDAFYQGKIYLQSLASMLPVLVLDPQRGEQILDVCAAPGSKTTQIAMMMENTGSITALEQNQIRYDKLMYNSRLQGATMIEGVKMDAKKYLETPFVNGGSGDLASEKNPQSPSSSTAPFDKLRAGSFKKELWDKILLDAPCSAEGRINIANEKSYGFWSHDNIARKAELQYELLTLAYTRLKKWWTLVYSTCTLAPEENEWVIAKFLKSNHNASLDTIDIGLSEKPWWKCGLTRFEGENYGEAMKLAVRILLSEETEGFFIAKIVKK